MKLCFASRTSFYSVNPNCSLLYSESASIKFTCEFYGVRNVPLAVESGYDNIDSFLTLFQPDILIDSTDMNGDWICIFYTLKDTPDMKNQVTRDGHSYTETVCRLHVTINEVPGKNTTANLDPNLLIYIGIGGICLFTVIIVQMGVIIYFKLRAQRITRLESLSLRVRNPENNDNKRYSTTPNRKNRITQFFSKNYREESRIYETLEELQNNSTISPPTPPIENIPTLKRKKAEINMKKRPPAPLPEPQPQQDLSDDESTIALREMVRQQCAVKKESPHLMEETIRPEPYINKPNLLAQEATLKASRAPPPHPKATVAKKLVPTPPGKINKMAQGSSIVASELDTIFKKKQKTAAAPFPVNQIPPSAKPVPENLIQKKGKQAPPPPTALKSVPGPQKLPKPDSTLTVKQKTQLLNQHAMSPQAPAPLAPGPLTKVPVRPTPQLPPIQQAPSGKAPRPPPGVPESVYEEYEEAVYNGDEWTYEQLPQSSEYNLYSI
ncbi:unnamed protein product [Chilo suppressalis]|uniref:Uncharacterized protein n=1 Tax=Chilo suppressalis TaxID=168631 RepID=A0ABN8L8W6_CHISP|nr:unnamed protein product [Chilo suppressalis]